MFTAQKSTSWRAFILKDSDLGDQWCVDHMVWSCLGVSYLDLMVAAHDPEEKEINLIKKRSIVCVQG